MESVVDDRVTDEALEAVALNRFEYHRILELLGRPPNELELGMFGALWSEHCGYKHSRALLSRLPTDSPSLLVKAGEENAGAVDIGDGLAVVFKVESHNHPSAVEPFEGAATGVGGIIRDIFTMGARPIALFDSLRFGPLDAPRNRYLAGGIVGGVGSYGNCVGIPTVGGEVVVEDCYAGNPLVNAMCVGLLRHDQLTRAEAVGEGNPIILVGADTGRDGIQGATFASVEDPEKSARGVVQVGNPFLEKLLIEACLEALATGAIVGLQDLGAAGLTSSSVEAAARTGAGVCIDVDKVSRRAARMTPYEVMLSESQERMLVVAERGREQEIIAVFDKWGLHSDVIGAVTSDARVTVAESGTPVAHIPIEHLNNPPEYRLPVELPDYLATVNGLDIGEIPEPDDVAQAFLSLLSSPNIASRECVYRTYDQTVGSNTVAGPGADAAVLRVKGANRAIALSTDGNGRVCYLNPRGGGAMAVAEAARNVVCAGARPLAITNCLNFGSPDNPAVYYQLAEVIEGMAEACAAFEIPVTGGNVSLYNEADGVQIFPTPVIGMLGVIDDVDLRVGIAFAGEGDLIAVIGDVHGSLDGSEYLKLAHGKIRGRPDIDLSREVAVQSVCISAIEARLLSSAHDVSDGGLAVALAESCFAGGIGAAVDPGSTSVRSDELWFGESPSRILVSLAPGNLEEAKALASAQDVAFEVIGRVGGGDIVLGDEAAVPLDIAREKWSTGLSAALSGKSAAH